jgi:PAS domain S-box-containing protein
MKMEERFESIFNHANEGILIAHANGLIQVVNPRCSDMFGYEGNELVGQKIEVLVPTQVRGRHEGHRQSYHDNPHARPMGKNMVLEGLRKDGTTFPVEISLSHYQEDGVSNVIAFIIDVTERKSQEKKIQEAYDALQAMNNGLERKVLDRTMVLEEALVNLEKSKDELSKALIKERELNELKSRFVSTASHEFRTPLSTILSSIALVEQYGIKADWEKQVKHVQRIRQSVGGLTEILEDILSLSKLEEGKIEVQWININIKELVADLLEELQTILKPGQSFDYQFSGLEHWIGDPKILRNTIMNLISNAIKFSHESKPIGIELYRTKDQLTIVVQDQGLGIPPSEMPHLFQRFHRASNAINIPGTGLGLSIVKRCVELMNGDISVKSQIEKGTTFTIVLKVNE